MLIPPTILLLQTIINHIESPNFLISNCVLYLRDAFFILAQAIERYHNFDDQSFDSAVLIVLLRLITSVEPKLLFRATQTDLH